MITHKEGIHNKTEFRGITPCRLTRDVSNLFLRAPVRVVGCVAQPLGALGHLWRPSLEVCAGDLSASSFIPAVHCRHTSVGVIFQNPPSSLMSPSRAQLLAMNDRQTWGRSPNLSNG